MQNITQLVESQMKRTGSIRNISFPIILWIAGHLYFIKWLYHQHIPRPDFWTFPDNVQNCTIPTSRSKDTLEITKMHSLAAEQDKWTLFFFGSFVNVWNVTKMSLLLSPVSWCWKKIGSNVLVCRRNVSHHLVIISGTVSVSESIMSWKMFRTVSSG